MDAHRVVRDFEAALCEYTNSPYAVAVNSCTSALFLCCLYLKVKNVVLPKRTYHSVPMAIINAGGSVSFDDRDWRGTYRLQPYPILDSARRFSSGMYCSSYSGWHNWYNAENYRPIAGGYECVSFHWSKILGVSLGGAILHSDHSADHWFRKMRWHGRTEGVPPKNENFTLCGYDFRILPAVAADALIKLSHLPQHNEDLPNDDYPDLSKIELFRNHKSDCGHSGEQ